MNIKSLIPAAALALAASLASASAAEQFDTLKGITAQPLIVLELDQVRGAAGFQVTTSAPAPGDAFVTAAVAIADDHAPDRHVPVN